MWENEIKHILNIFINKYHTGNKLPWSLDNR